MAQTLAVKTYVHGFKKSLSLKHRLEFALTNTIKMDDGSYIFVCDTHGIVSGKPQGFYEHLVCKKCLDELYGDQRIEAILTTVKTNVSIGELREPNDLEN